MSILRGRPSIHRYAVLGPVPDDDEFAAALQEHRWRPFEDGLEEERVGFCDWRNPLLNADPVYCNLDRFYVFDIRVSTRKVPADLLRAETDLRLQQVMKERDLPRIGKETRLSVQDEVKVDLLKKVLPTVKTFAVMWDRKGGVVHSTAAGSRGAGILATLFHKAWGLELQTLTPLPLMGKVRPSLDPMAVLALDPVSLEVEHEAR